MHLKELVPFVTGPGGTLAAARYGNAFRAAAPRAVPDGSGAAGRKVAGDAEAFRLLVARPARAHGPPAGSAHPTRCACAP